MTSRTFRWGLLALAAALVANTVAGPLVTGWIDYPITESMLNQLLGLEVVSLALVVPLLVVAAELVRRDHRAAAAVAFGPCGYAAYMFVQYVVGPAYTSYSLVVLAQVAIASLAGAMTLASWARLVRAPLPQLVHATRRGVVLLLLAAFVLARYLPALAGGLTGAELSGEFREAPAFYWSIVLLDLGVVVPATCVAGLAVLGRRPAGTAAYYAVLGWFALVPPSVASMAAVMVVRDDPYASMGTFAFLTVAALAMAGFAAAEFRRLFLERAPDRVSVATALASGPGSGEK
ncbi:membrane hypothetical protein [metagenome]|uniref:Integral membrane protein n=1 Tax=metagenome TaxID=256318 RepID=A0A2P2C5F2_9ZZZZ